MSRHQKSGRRELPNNVQHQQRTSGNSSHDIKLSKALSYLLRHGAPKERVAIHPGGYVDIDEVLRLPQFAKYSIENIKSVVGDNDKQRFTIRTDESTGREQICANQGHSFKVDDSTLEPINDPSQFPVVIHGTYMKNWKSIKDIGLRRMNRIHIHFAPGEPGEAGVISGMRTSAEVYIYANIGKAIADGLKFYRSLNNVILTPGNDDGILPPKYFAKVVNVKTNEILYAS